ncbi:hypothetical protein PGT21_007415 [Puccinia graminis f. sp. tritici]|uniref:Uncharacterized protein n=2 Tax=Puccinia graminis f. sp. tritici TaxID=56615 RepID=E3KKB7_PUCGT|nr:uncharacterized protein PGTG_10901 [Puccinia graminis f. sp. tritici CRL 75-36-700-3]EFP84742.1 hypothetical protein PGTG_10901 [Puccinia graminis f. sp. tritici CRL 75-36-700-3]KAA1101111.1 hypothetical protein PGT21_007415 [Puccinia graminis f. sp. tritici]
MLGSTSQHTGHVALSGVHLRQQADVVIKRFTNLVDKCQSARENDFTLSANDFTLSAQNPTLSIDETELKKGLLLQLESCFLPQLRQQLITLLQLTNPYELLEKAASKFKLILEIQAGLDITLDQILCAIDLLCPQPMQLNIVRINDQHLKELKHYRLHGLCHHIKELVLPEIQEVCFDSTELIRRLNFSTKTYEAKDDVALAARENLMAEVSNCSYLVEHGINWMVATELDTTQGIWRKHTFRIDEHLKYLLMLDPTINIPHKRPRGYVIKLVKSIVPVVKLSRLFLSKSSERGMNRKPLVSLFTTMSSNQLDFISDLPSKTDRQLAEIETLLKEFNGSARERSELKKAVQEITTRFETAFLLILVHFVPLIPDTDVYHNQKYFKDWFATWHTQFTIAIGNLLNEIGIFGSS